MSINTGGPAFPRPASVDTSGGTLPDGDVVVGEFTGMSLRDYFAGQALAGIVGDPGRSGSFQSLASDAYSFADAMLAERASS